MSERPNERFCTQCGAIVDPKVPACWNCGAPTIESWPVMAGFAPQSPLHGLQPQSDPKTFTLTTLLIVVTLCAVFFGLVREAPGLAMLVACTVAPALALTYRDLSRRRRRGEEITRGHKIERFLVSVLMVWGIGVIALLAIAAALFVVCLFAISGIGGMR